MNGHEERDTAILAAAFGGMLYARAVAGSAGTDDATTRDLAILARVLENRLAQAREALGCSVALNRKDVNRTTIPREPARG